MKGEAPRDSPGASTMVDDALAWSLAASQSNDGLWFIDLTQGRVRLSPRALELLGYRAGDPSPSIDQLSAHVDAAHLGALRQAVDAIRRGASKRLDSELEVLTVGGERRWMHLRARAPWLGRHAPRTWCWR